MQIEKTERALICHCRIYVLLILGVISSATCQEAFTPEEALETITADDLMRIVNRLASPDFEGRLSGGEGYNKAALWVAGEFERCGLEPEGDNGSFFQYFDVEYNRIDGPAVFTLIEDDSLRQVYSIGADFVVRGFSGQGLITAPVVFCGYGVSSPENDYDDYVAVDVRDNIVMVFKGAPPWEGDWGEVRMPRVKSNTAHRHGAIGMLLVSEPGKSRSQALIGSVFHGPGEHLPNFPAIHVSQEVGADLLQRSNSSLEDLYAQINETHQPYSFSTGVEAHLEIHAAYTKRQRTMNVIGLIEGEDPDLKQEVVILGAHLDHVGAQAGLITFAGANDNASGVSALIEVAEALSLLESRPKRSILCIAFSAEEQGILGSKYYTANPVLPLDRTEAMINIDCIGSGEGMRVGGGVDYPDLYDIVQEVNDTYIHFELPKSGRGGGADAEPFYEFSIPTLYFATTKGYTHLHQIADTPETLNPPLLEKASRLAFLTLLSVANQ